VWTGGASGGRMASYFLMHTRLQAQVRLQTEAQPLYLVQITHNSGLYFYKRFKRIFLNK
jgi:hypothetical protein